MRNNPLPSNADEQVAVDWVIRSQRPDFADWEELTAWMQADDQHAESFNRLSLRAEIVSQSLREQPSRPAIKPSIHPTVGTSSIRRTPRWRTPLMAVAASVAIICTAAIGWTLRSRLSTNPDASMVVLKVPAGQTRRYAMGERATILLGGDTQMTVLADAGRIELLHGQAYFQVRHDAVRPLHVFVAGSDITDLGTRFDVRRRDGVTDIAVGEGEIAVARDAPPLRLAAGQAVSIDATSSVRRDVTPQTVGSWREGRLSYDDAPLPRVADDIASLTAARITLTPQAARLRFAGMLRIRSGDAGDLTGLAATLGVRATRQQDGWLLSTAGDAPKP